MKYSVPILIFLLFQTGTPVLAVPIKVRSGEHADFSRLVIELNNQTRWTVENFEDNSVLSVFNDGLDLDTSEVFKFIPKSRIESVEVSHSENEPLRKESAFSRPHPAVISKVSAAVMIGFMFVSFVGV